MPKDKTYAEKLKDPRWQRKRLEVFNRDNFRCQYCLNEHFTLHVHHLTYQYGFEPWEADDSDLTTICEDCHDLEHRIEERNRRLFDNIYALDEDFRNKMRCPACGNGDFNFVGSDVICSVCGWRCNNPDIQKIITDLIIPHQQ